VQEELVREKIESIGHKMTSLWNFRHRVIGYRLSLFFLDIEPAVNNSEIYLQNMKVQIEPHRQK
jgi:heat shock protein HspQ